MKIGNFLKYCETGVVMEKCTNSSYFEQMPGDVDWLVSVAEVTWTWLG